jgi:hypothetical protein
MKVLAEARVKELWKKKKKLYDVTDSSNKSARSLSPILVRKKEEM